jgi:hypothetical protein
MRKSLLDVLNGVQSFACPSVFVEAQQNFITVARQAKAASDTEIP